MICFCYFLVVGHVSNYNFENHRLPKLFLFDVVFVFVVFYYFRIFQTCFNFVFILFTRVMVFCIFKLPIELFVTTEEWILFSLTPPEFLGFYHLLYAFILLYTHT